MSIDVNLNIKGRVEALHLEPNDLVVATIDPAVGHVSPDQFVAIRDELVKAFAPHQVIVLFGLSIAREAAS